MTVEIGTGLTILAMILAGIVFYFKGVTAFQRNMENMSKSFTTDINAAREEFGNSLTTAKEQFVARVTTVQTELKQELVNVKDELKEEITVVRLKQENHDVRLTSTESNVTALFGRLNTHVNGKH